MGCLCTKEMEKKILKRFKKNRPMIWKENHHNRDKSKIELEDLKSLVQEKRQDYKEKLKYYKSKDKWFLFWSRFVEKYIY
jgi:hypothetical protein